jgi:hypothetical protein
VYSRDTGRGNSREGGGRGNGASMRGARGGEGRATFGRTGRGRRCEAVEVERGDAVSAGAGDKWLERQGSNGGPGGVQEGVAAALARGAALPLGLGAPQAVGHLSLVGRLAKTRRARGVPARAVALPLEPFRRTAASWAAPPRAEVPRARSAPHQAQLPGRAVAPAAEVT